MYKVLDLFCGAGGLSLGFKLAKYKIIGGVDHDHDSTLTHLKNFKNSITIHDDICHINNEQIKNLFSSERVDIIIGGPPCQGFSSANKQQKSEHDPRNQLFFEFIRFVEILKPKAVVIENVKQILTKNDGFAKNQILQILNNLGYNVDFRVLNSSEFGVPQIRHRAFFIGIRKDLGSVDFDKIKKTPNIITVDEAIGELYELEYKNGNILNSKPATCFQKYVRASNNKLVNHDINYPKLIVQERMRHVPEGGNWRYIPDELWDKQRTNRHSSAYKRLDSNKPSITIDTGHMNYFHPKYNRVPTVRESARLQSFPDDFVFMGSPTSQLRQVGNAVPPLMAKAVAELIKESLAS